MADSKLSMRDLIGDHYNDFWRFKGRYRVCKGSRASKKSKTAALWYIANMMRYPGANLLVIRKVFRTLKDSCFTELKWAIHRLGVSAYWSVKLSPLEMIYKPTGQRIYFRGLDDAMKITSITVETGSLCWMLIEEAYEITDEDDFNMLDESIRGEIPPGLFKQITLIFNPWNERHWLKSRFFDVNEGETIVRSIPNGQIKQYIDESGASIETLTITTNYQMNEWLDAQDRAQFDRMKRQNYSRYKVAGLGEWGIIEGVIYENWKELAFDFNEISKRPGVVSAFGLDFGYTNDPTALFCGLIDKNARELYVFDELYERALTNQAIYQRIATLGYAKERIRADSSEPKSIDELRRLGLQRITGARKGRDSVINGIQHIQNYWIYIHPRCVNFLTEISNYAWSVDRNGRALNTPVDDHNHLMDAMRYALEGIVTGAVFTFG